MSSSTEAICTQLLLLLPPTAEHAPWPALALTPMSAVAPPTGQHVTLVLSPVAGGRGKTMERLAVRVGQDTRAVEAAAAARRGGKARGAPRGVSGGPG